MPAKVINRPYNFIEPLRIHNFPKTLNHHFKVLLSRRNLLLPEILTIAVVQRQLCVLLLQ
jgi:hypothetical protein